MKATRLHRLLGPLLLILVGVLAYWNSFDGAFIYDDIEAVRDNVHIRRLWPLSEAISLDQWTTGSTVDGRPVLSLSFALNHALLGNDPWGYHLVNVLIHLSCALLLFGIVRRTLTVRCRDRGDAFGEMSRQARHDNAPGGALSPPVSFRGLSCAWPTTFALAVALLWVVHPIQTESVTYIAQRAESLMGMLYLLTLYCAIRGMTRASEGCSGSSAEPGRTSNIERPTSNIKRLLQYWRSDVRCPMFSNNWYRASVLACALGMGVKEVMITAPVAVLLYDHTFVSGSILKALRKRPGFYAALSASWLVILVLLFYNRTDIVENYEVTPWIPYLFAQPGVILHYLRLCAWPRPLVMEYNWPLATASVIVAGQTALVGGGLVLSLWGLWRRHWAGFAGTFFFLVLVPTSSIHPAFQVAHEHRMYLPLAAVVALVYAGVYACLSRVPRLSALARRAKGTPAALIPILAVAVLLGIMTDQRNREYYSEIAFWGSNVAHRPESFDALCGLGRALQAQGRPAEAIEHYRAALRIKPDYALAHNNLGNALQALGRRGDAIAHYREALRLKPDYAEAHNNWGMALETGGQRQEAMAHYQQAVRIDPDMAQAHLNLGNALQASGRTREAMFHYRRAVQLKPDYADAHNNLANALLLLGQPQEAIAHYREAVRLEPGHAEAHYGWGVALGMAGHIREATRHFEEALRLKPDHAAALHALREAREMSGQGRRSE